MLLGNTIVHSLVGNVNGEKGFFNHICTNQITTSDLNYGELNFYGNIAINGVIRKINCNFANVNNNLFVKGNTIIVGTQINSVIKADIIHTDIIRATEVWEANTNIGAQMLLFKKELNSIKHDILLLKNAVQDINREIKNLKFIRN
jgi:hypothetical protein